MANARVARGRKSEDIWAEYLRLVALYPEAEGVGASLPGKDVLHTPGVSFELKATSQARITAALVQAGKNMDEGDIPVVVYRPPGYGAAKVGGWIFATTGYHGCGLLKAAGYGA